MTTRKKFIVESNFDPAVASERFASIIKEHNYRSIQIVCLVDNDILLERFTRREGDISRHYGHKIEGTFLELEKRLKLMKNISLHLESPLLTYNTNYFNQDKLDKLVLDIKKVIYP